MVTVHTGQSTLILPVRPMAEADEQRWTVSRDLIEYRSALGIVKNAGKVHFDDIDVTSDVFERYSWVADEFCSPVAETAWSMTFARDGWEARSETRTPTEFVIDARLDGYEGERRCYSRNWHRMVPRDQV
jgi:hypothetical protein